MKADAKLTLMPLSMDHLDHVMTWVNDHEVMQYFAARQTDISREEEAEYLRTLRASKSDHAFSMFADGDTYVGQCSINQIHWPSRNGRLFVVIRREMQGRGFGPEAVSKVLQHAFDPKGLNLHKVWLIVRAENREAQAMYLRLGFSFEGLLKDEYRVGDRYHDMVRMGVINPNG